MIARDASFDDLLDFTGGDPLLRAMRVATDRAWRGGDAAVYLGLDNELSIRSVVAFGDRGDIPGLLRAIAPELPDGMVVTVPRGTPPSIPLVDVDDWDFRSTTSSPPAQPGEDRVSWLPESDDPDVTELLKVANPGSSAKPGDAKVNRWAGIRDDDGRLIACLADSTRLDDVGHVSGIAVDPRARGQQLGPAITAWAAREMLAAGKNLVALGMYASNDIGRRMYDRLKFSDDHRLTSGDIHRSVDA